MIAGIDVSNWQQDINWQEVADSGVTFAIIKASEGANYEDKFFETNWRAAKKAGLVRGAYHFAKPSESQPQDEATRFISCIARVGGLQPGDIVALDLEDAEVEPGQDLSSWAFLWCETMQRRLGVRPFLYSNVDYLDKHNIIAGDHSPEQWPLWLASWRENRPNAPMPWGRVVIWQKSSDGQIPGINGRVDLNEFEGERENLVEFGYQPSLLNLWSVMNRAKPVVNEQTEDEVRHMLDVMWGQASNIRQEASGLDAMAQRLRQSASEVAAATVNIKRALGLE